MGTRIRHPDGVFKRRRRRAAGPLDGERVALVASSLVIFYVETITVFVQRCPIGTM